MSESEGQPISFELSPQPVQMIEVVPVNLFQLQQAAEDRYHRIYETSNSAISNAWCSIQYHEGRLSRI